MLETKLSSVFGKLIDQLYTYKDNYPIINI